MVSFVIPVYNAEKTISRCVDSILAQTYTDIEVILIDDDSRDNSSQICKKYCEKDSRVKYYKKENGGAASARNYGLRVSKGQYIQFVDADDYIKCDMTEKMLKSLLKNSCDWCICGIEFISLTKIEMNTFGDHFCKNRMEICSIINEFYDSAILHSCCNKLYKRNLIHELMPESYIYGEDYVFNLRYLQNVLSLTVIDEPLYIYDCTNESVTRGKKKNTATVIKEQYELSCAIFLELFQDEKLIDTVTTFFIKNLLSNIVSQTTIFGITTKCVNDTLVQYEKETQRVCGNGMLEQAIHESNYRYIARLLRKKRIDSMIKSAIKRIVYAFN